MPRSTGSAVVTALAALSIVVPAAGQRPQTPTFRATSDLVEVHAVVTDDDGRPARGLTAVDFVVAEDGVPQNIENFAFVDIAGATAPAMAADRLLVPAVATNLVDRTTRQYVIVLDAFHVDSAQSTNVRRLAREFITDVMVPGDVAAVVTIGAPDSQPFTTDASRLLRVVDRFVGHKSRSATLNAGVDALGREIGEAAEDFETGAKANAARVALDILARMCDSLGTTQGLRRSIVLFSEGIELDTTDLIGADQRPGRAGAGLRHPPSRHAALVLQAQREMLIAARRANVAIHTIDPRGSSIGQESIMTAGPTIDPRTGRPVFPTLGLMEEVRRGQGTLRVFAEETGGLAVVNTNNIRNGFDRIVQASSVYYVLAYRPADTSRDGRYRRISVAVKPRGLQVTARKGYFAEDAAAAASPPDEAGVKDGPPALSTTMRRLLASQLPVAGLGVRATGGPIAMDGDNVVVAVVFEIDTSELAFRETGDQIANDIEMGYVAVDDQGTVQAATASTGRLRLPRTERASVSHGLRYAIEVPLPPGRYQIRLGAHETAGDVAGSAVLDVDALRFDAMPLAIGAVLITAPSAAMPTTGRTGTIGGRLPAPPTASYEFQHDETVSALVSVMGTAATREVTLSASVRNASGGLDLRHAPTSAPASERGLLVPIQLALGRLTPGTYVMTFEARAASGETASRAFTILVK